MKYSILMLLLLGVSYHVGAETVNLSGKPWQFTLGKEFPGATGKMTMEGNGDERVITTVSDFSNGGNYTGIILPLTPPRDIKKLSFRITSPAKHVAVQVDDSQNQTFVRFLPLSGNWDANQTVEIERFQIPGDRLGAHWGGPDDGVVRPPFRRLIIRTLGSSTEDKSRPQTIRISRILAEFSTIPAPTIYRPRPEDFRLNSGGEFPGAKGSLCLTEKGVTVHSDFTGGGNYIGTYLDFPVGIHAESLRFRIQTSFPWILVEVRDANGQNVHQTIHLSEKPDQWQKINVKKLFDPGNKAFGHWGGSNDGKLVMPIKRITIRWLKGAADNLPVFDTSIADFEVTSQQPVPPQELPPTAKAISPEQLVVSPGGPPAAFELDRPYRKSSLSYTLRDYAAREIDSGELPVSGSRTFQLPVPKNPGFYEYELPELNFTAGLVVLPRFPEEPDDFFAMDMAASVFPVFQDTKLAEAYLSILAYAGIRNIRERLVWRKIEEKAPGKFNFNALNSDVLRKVAAKHNLKVLDVFHDAPRWSGASTNRLSNDFFPFPRNLLQAAASWRRIGHHWQSLWNGLEVWNEPEIAFGASLPGDQVTALQRTISRVFQSEKINTPIIGGVFTGTISNDRMMRLYLQNGLLEDADVFSIHSYADAEQLQRVIADFRHALRKDSRQGIPMWITECGKPWPVGTVRAKVDDDLFSAASITMKAIEAKANGVAMFYPFIFQFFEENVNNFGMMDRNHTPMRSLAGYLNLVRTLAHHRYAGDLVLETGGKINRVFLKGDKAVIVVYSGDQRTLIKLPHVLKIREATGIDGRILPRNHEYLERDGLLYLHTSRQAVEPFLNPETGAMQLLKLAEAYKPTPRAARPVVMQFDFDRKTTSWTLYGYLFNDRKNARFPVKFNNLSNKPLTIRPELKLPAGVTIGKPLPGKLELPPESTVTAEFTLDLSGGFVQTPELDILIRDKNNSASPLLIGVKNWNFEKLEVSRGLHSDRPARYYSPDSSWTVLDSPTKWKKWEGGHLPNIRAAFRLSYEPETLQLQVLVEDRKFHQPYAIAQAWRADSVQFALQTLNEEGQRKQPFTEISAALTPQGAKLYRHSDESGNRQHRGELKRSTLEFRKNQDGMLYTIRLDAGELGISSFSPGMKFGAALLINSSEGRQRDGYLHWGDGIGENKNPREFNILILR